MKNEKWKLFKKTVIYRSGDNSPNPKPYLIRWNLFGCPWFSIKIHKLLIPDDDCLHDHPWSFLTFILKGGYFETTNWKTKKSSQLRYAGEALQKIGQGIQYVTWHGPGNFLWRPNPFPHRLNLKLVGGDQWRKFEYIPCWTLLVTFKREREWGFWTPKGWIEWFKYDSKSRCE
jgi:hypothetical protein